jgi:hypothetical protein
MNHEEIHQRAIALLKERGAIQDKLRKPLARIQEIEWELADLDAKRRLLDVSEPVKFEQ